jgi:hypothetical protein
VFDDQVTGAFRLQTLLCGFRLAEPGDELALMVQLHDEVVETL